METLESLIKQMQEWPASVLVVVVLNFIGSSIRRAGWISNKVVPSTLMMLGAIIYIFVGDTGTVAWKVRYPAVVLGLYGMLLGVFASIFNTLIWRNIEKRFPPFNKNGDEETDTTTTKRPTPRPEPPKNDPY